LFVLRSKMAVVTKPEMATYYALRKTTFDIGLTDRKYPRMTPPIRRDESIGQISLSRYQDCVAEELQFLALHAKHAQFDREAYQRQLRAANERVRDWRAAHDRMKEEARSYRLRLGLDPEAT